ncbi:hypothetical protein TNCV_1662861 [Trichonephila clavipes]|nr:hypothetical protein TNCV_1662861 [Trichonephila clavipes]
MDVFFWDHMTILVNETPILSVEDLIAQISLAAGSIRDLPRTFQKVRNSMQRGCQVCQMTSAHNLEHLYNLLINVFSPINVLLFLFFFSASLHHSSRPGIRM